MKEFRWDLLKNERLKRTRGVSFDEILQARVVAIRRHPRRPDQRLMVCERRGHLWVVPFVERGDVLFLKTLYPSRKYTKRYRKGGV
ncbi:MAG: toxin [Candidatus Omnitrophica bacterium]|nr:toxin [Candidatus Omnitrophota bacterium]